MILYMYAGDRETQFAVLSEDKITKFLSEDQDYQILVRGQRLSNYSLSPDKSIFLAGRLFILLSIIHVLAP